LIKLNPKSRKLLLLQRNELLSEKQKWLRKKFGRFIFTNIFVNYFQNKNLEKNTEDLFIKEIDTFKKYLPSSIKNTMDIGCGLGIINIYLNEIFQNNSHFFLLDKNRIDNKIKYGFGDNYESYNDLNETRNILLNNNLKNSYIHTLDVEKSIIINEKIDLVISLKSMGYHYPFEKYLDLFRKTCSQNTVFIFDINDEYYREDTIHKYFENFQIIYEEKSIHPLKRLYCRKFKS
tara:strand:+ start:167 stop:865 length:699 start_codon:yes stop_codon:yes gene_type:complete